MDEHVESGHRVKQQGEHEEIEGPVVASSHAVVYPRTMVVIPLHTFLTHTAVPAPLRPYRLTVRTELSWVDFLDELLRDE